MLENFDKNYKYSLILVLILFFGLSTYFVVNYFNKYSSNNQILVVGTFNQELDNRIATFTVNTKGESPDKEKAEQLNNEKVTKIIEILQNFGISEKDYTTQNYNSYRKIEYYMEGGVSKSRETDWVFNQAITINLKDISKMSDFVNALNQVNSEIIGPNYSVDTQNIDETVILNGAFEKAKKKAESLATTSGRKLGKVVTINEVSSSTPELRPFMEKTASIGAGGGLPVLPAGSSNVEKTVLVVFELE